MSLENKGKKSVSFYAFIDKGTENIGRKIKDYCEGLIAQGYDATPKLITAKGILNRIKKGRNLKSDSADIVIIRNSIYTPFLFFSIIQARLRDKKVIIEMPTPLRVMIFEVWNSERSFLSKVILSKLLLLFFPISLWPAHRILNYSNESFYFSLGLKRKSRLITNGIHVDRVPMRTLKVRGSSDPIIFVGVAMFQASHGYERMIRSLHAYKKMVEPAKQKRILFNLVGDGSLRQEWENLAEELNLSQIVQFKGVKTGKDLEKIFDNADIAVGKLAPYKINLQIASELKLRGYCTRGVPFIKSYDDPDFPNDLEFVFSVENSDKLINIEEVIHWFEALNIPDVTKRMRDYAEEHLDYKKKELLYL